MRNYLLLLLLAGSATFAQQKPKFGVNLGSTLSNIRASDSDSYPDFFFEDTKYDINFLIGISIEVPLSEKFSLVGNVNYERKTFKKSRKLDSPTLPIEGDPNFNPDRTADIKQRLEYITIPLNLKYYVGNQKRFFVNAGPYAGFFLDSNLKIEGNTIKDNGNSLFSTMDFGINLGVGTNFKINEKSSLNLEIRHNYGLTDITSKEHDFIKLRTNSFNLIANWQFNL